MSREFRCDRKQTDFCSKPRLTKNEKLAGMASSPKGDGVMDSTLACYVGGRGSIPTVGTNLSIQMVLSPSRV